MKKRQANRVGGAGRGSILGVVIYLFGLITAAEAVPIFFFGEDLATGRTVPPLGNALAARNDFLGQLVGGVGTEDFEGFLATDTAPFALNFPGTSGSITATLGNASGICDGATNCIAPASGQFATSGQKWLFTDESLVADFSSPISALGFYATDVGDLNAQLTVTLTDIVGNDLVVNVPHTLATQNANGDLLFWGFVDPTNRYSSIQFGLVGSNADFFGFDDFTIGDLAQLARIPEPGGGALWLLGGVILAYQLRFGRRSFANAKRRSS